MEFPLIFDIKRASLEDGPGVRTAVFLKGCSLNCFWCHNPEGKSPLPQNAFFEEKCIRCGACAGLESEPERCPVQARKRYGKYYPPEELFSILSADRAYYEASGGGVTFSGGECLLYPEYLAKTAELCRKSGISVAADTAGNVPFSHFETVLPLIDLFLFDIKCLDPELHRRGTGSDNRRILENLERLIRLGKEILVRIPEIPGFNEGEEVRRTAEYCEERGLPYEILPYHDFWKSKKKALDDAEDAHEKS